jgi:hypothetical protein
MGLQSKSLVILLVLALFTSLFSMLASVRISFSNDDRRSRMITVPVVFVGNQSVPSTHNSTLKREALLHTNQNEFWNNKTGWPRPPTTFMWYKGMRYTRTENVAIHVDAGDEDDPKRTYPVIDAISIGSNFNIQQMEAQAQSWGSHPSIRYLFGATELDDADTLCSRVKRKFVVEFAQYCRYRNYNSSLHSIRARFPIQKWLQKENKTRGWLCAQKRFAHAIGKIGRFYREGGPDSLPDFLFIQDDDTWYGIHALVNFLSQRSQETPYVTAGCLIQWPVNVVNFSFPYGGFGTIFNKKAVERLIKTVFCKTATEDAHTRKVCSRLQENLAGESMAFEEGMSISDLMDRHATMHEYRKYKTWKNPGYCMLGDWVIGYYANYYELGSRENAKLNYIHMDNSLGYTYYHGERSCLNANVENCRKSATKYACHRIDPVAMRELHLAANHSI